MKINLQIRRNFSIFASFNLILYGVFYQNIFKISNGIASCLLPLLLHIWIEQAGNLALSLFSSKANDLVVPTSKSKCNSRCWSNCITRTGVTWMLGNSWHFYKCNLNELTQGFDAIQQRLKRLINTILLSQRTPDGRSRIELLFLQGYCNSTLFTFRTTLKHKQLTLYK